MGTDYLVLLQICFYCVMRENSWSLSGCQSFRTQAISYQGHFVPCLVISYLSFGHFVPSNNHFVPRSFRTNFGHFVPRSNGYEMTIWWSIRTQVIWYKSFGTPFGHFVPILVISYPAKMDGWIDERTDAGGQACFDWNDKLTPYSYLLHNEFFVIFEILNNCQTLLSVPWNTSK